MKEIKFRIWDEVYKEFRYWGFVDPDRDVFVGLPQNSRIDIDYCRKHSEQFTGLLDKNGVEIYEGDRVESQHFFASEVLFKDGMFLALDTPLNQDWEGCPGNEWEVIGNIYENSVPEEKEG